MNLTHCHRRDRRSHKVKPTLMYIKTIIHNFMSSKNEHSKTKHTLTAIVLFGIYTMKLKTYVHTKTCT